MTRHLYFIKNIALFSIFSFFFLPLTLFAQVPDNVKNVRSISPFSGYLRESTVAYNKTSGEPIELSEHWWKFSAKAGEGVILKLTAHLDIGNLRVVLYNQKGEHMKSSASIENNETTIFGDDIAVTGDYYIKIYSLRSNARGNYDLSVYKSWFSVDINDNDRDIYSTFRTARYLSSGTTYTRSDSSDQYYRFTVNAGSELNISLQSTFSTMENVRFTVYDKNQEFIGNSSSRALSKNINLSGLYYLKVFNAGTGQYTFSTEGVNNDSDSDGDQLKDATEYHHSSNPFKIDTDEDGRNDYVELKGGNKPSVYSEYLDSQVSKEKSQAISFPYRDKKINAEYLDGIHWWKFNAVSGEKITTVLTGYLDNQSIRVFIYDENENYLGRTGYVEHGKTSIFDAEIPSSGTYYLKVIGKNSSTNGNYDLTIYNDRQHTNLADEDRDFYYNKATARNLSNGTYVRDRISHNSDVRDQFFYFTASAGSTLDISLSAHFNNRDVRFSISYVEGSYLVGSGDIADGETKSISRTLNSSGSFFLKVTGGGFGTYDLAVSGINSVSLPIPETVHNVQATDGTYANKVRITWNSVSTATSYKVYRCSHSTSTSSCSLLSGGTASPYDDTSSAVGTTYYYRVKACNTSGCSSNYSAANEGYRSSNSTPVPGTVLGVQATDGTYTDKVRVAWNSVTTATNYKVYRCSSATSTSSCSLLNTDSSSPYDDTSGAVGTTYYYRVKACNTSGCSSNYSVANSGHKSSDSGSVPGTVTGVTATNNLSDRVTITWNHVQTAVKYNIYRCTNELTSSCVFLGGLPTSGVYYTSGEAEVFYYHRIKACNASGRCSANYSSAAVGHKTASNDTALEANNIELNSALRQSIDPEDDVDWIKFTLSSPSRLTIRTSSPDNIDTTLRLYNSTEEIAFNDDISDTSGQLTSEISYDCSDPLKAGTYYIEVKSFPGFFGSPNVIPIYFIEVDNVEPCATSGNAELIVPLIPLLFFND